MPDSKQNPAAARASEVGVVWGHFLKVARRSSYVEVIMTVWCYDDMLIWNLRRIGDLIGLADSIAGAGRGEVDGKGLGFEVFELDLSFACIAAASQRLDWLELRLGCRTQVDCEDLCFERIELS